MYIPARNLPCDLASQILLGLSQDAVLLESFRELSLSLPVILLVLPSLFGAQASSLAEEGLLNTAHTLKNELPRGKTAA